VIGKLLEEWTTPSQPGQSYRGVSMPELALLQFSSSVTSVRNVPTILDVPPLRLRCTRGGNVQDRAQAEEREKTMREVVSFVTKGKSVA